MPGRSTLKDRRRAQTRYALIYEGAGAVLAELLTNFKVGPDNTRGSAGKQTAASIRMPRSCACALLALGSY